MGAEQPSITLHSTWRFLIGSTIGAGAVATAGTYGVDAAGFNLITTVLFVAGWIFVAVVVLDLPVASTFSSTGVRRRMLLRRQFLAWQPSDSLVRARPSVVRHEAKLSQGGLVLRRGRRTYRFFDTAESADEFAVVIDLVDTSGSPGAVVDLTSLSAPPSSAPPTWLYRRRRWRPDGALGR